MQKVLILSYFFPPCNLTAANRTGSWAEQLHKYGFYPIVITRNWDKAISDQKILSEESGDETRVEIKDGYEVHYLSFKAGLRDKMYSKGFPLNVLCKPLTLYEVVGQHFRNDAVPYSNLLKYADRLLASDPEIELLIASAGPYPLFRFGWELKKRYPRLRWVADYRDDWSTKTLNQSDGLLYGLLGQLDRDSELKWVGSADKIVSVSDQLTNRISEFTGVPGITIPNGFSQKETDRFSKQLQEGQFTVSYSGYLYDAQKVELFLGVFCELCKLYSSQIKMKVRFIGLSYYKPAEERVRNLMSGYEEFLEITPRVPLEQCIQLELESDALLMMAYGEEKGIPASKIYQYIGTRKPVFVYPSDNDIIESLLQETGQGLIPRSDEEAFSILQRMIEGRIRGEELALEINEAVIQSHTRQNQTKKLALLLEQLTHSVVS